jgi:thioredoxin 1
MSFLGRIRGLIAVGMVAAAATSAYSGWLPDWLWRTTPNVPQTDNAGMRGENMSTTTPTVRKVLHVNESQFEQEVLRSPEPVLVDFYADWCGPCKLLAPVLEDLARETSAKIVKVNVDHAPGVANRYGVNSIPTLIVFRGGQATAGTVGLANKSHLRSLLER